MKLKTAGIILVWLASVGFAGASTNDVTTLVQKGLFEEEANHHLDAAIESYQQAIESFDKDRQLTATAIFHLGECYRLQGKTNEANAQYQRIVREFSDQSQLVDLSRGYLPKGTGHSAFVQGLAKISDGKPEQSTEEQDEIRQIKDIIQNSPDLINATAPGWGQGMTRLIVAASKGWSLAARLLVENGAIINPSSPQGFATPLGNAAKAGNKGMVEFLLAKGASINALDGMYGFAALHFAAQSGFKSVAETLLAHGADVDVRDHDGDRPLNLAAGNGYTTMAEVFLAHRADVNAPGKFGETALFAAIQANNLEMVQFLISNKASVNIKSASGQTPLLSAVGKQDINVAIVQALLDNGAEVDATARRGIISRSSSTTRTVTPLILAISKNFETLPQIVALLLQHSANPNLTDETGESPLDYAIGQVNTNTIEDLILHHADVNAPDKQGDPPLAYVSRFVNDPRREQIKQMLIQAGANEDYERRGAIFITQKGTGSIGNKIYSKGTNSANHYTLFELIAKAYGTLVDDAPRRPAGPGRVFAADGTAYAVGFPDLAHLTINRLKADGSKEEIAVDLDEILRAEDCSKNLSLAWGDVVLIPQLDHNVSERWRGLSNSERDALGKCLMRKVKVVVKEKTTQLALLPPIVVNSVYPSVPGRVLTVHGNGQPPPALAGALKGETVLYTFDLNEAVHQANVLLISSDLAHVKLTREASKADGQPEVMELNLETDPPPDVQLMDGDVVEIPERDQGVSQAK